MQTTLLLTSLLLMRTTNAQAPSHLDVDPRLTCQTGQVPSLACTEPLPVDEQCTCTCGDGAKFNQTRPDFTGSIPLPPALGDGEKMDHKPCTKEIIQPWIQISMPHRVGSFEPSEVSSNIIDNPMDSILLVADARQRCQNFVVFIDDVRVGVTSGTGPLDGAWCGDYGEE
ncbi:hypothetical protein G6011_07607 [Alternaria panax]|uniref:Uncharacterized protein n=1 Tax=Alternaria panax TaxID=48097 RepID=A0AAD4FF39_9PLEO|nr:hypothetical protein G6011_07607 [Alternaria panax]